MLKYEVDLPWVKPFRSNIEGNRHFLPTWEHISLEIFIIDFRVYVISIPSARFGYKEIARLTYNKTMIDFSARQYEGSACVEAFLTTAVGKAEVCTTCPNQLACLAL